jgi:hypothetical protein
MSHDVKSAEGVKLSEVDKVVTEVDKVVSEVVPEEGR